MVRFLCSCDRSDSLASTLVVVTNLNLSLDHTEDSRYILASSEHKSTEIRGLDPHSEVPVYGPLLTLPEYKIQLGEILREYFESCDPEEVIRSLEELGCEEYSSEIVKKSISLAMDKGPRERELVSRLLTYLHPFPLESMESGFNILLDSLDDLETDVPDAKVMAASFLARAVVDEVLSPAYMSEQNNNRPGNTVIEKAVSLLSREHCTARLERVWGPGDGRPVSELKKDMDQLLQEYLMSCELDEAARCVKELDAPHFHHELLKRGVTLAIEADGKSDDVKNIDAMAALFGFLTQNAIVSEHQVKKGIHRLKERLPDLSLDVPEAPKLFDTFVAFATEREFLFN